MTRWTLAIALSVLVVTAGCGMFNVTEVHHDVDIQNLSEESLHVTVTVTKDGQTFAEVTQTVHPKTTWAALSIDEPGEFEITVTLLDRGTTHSTERSLPLAGEHNSSTTRVQIGPGGVMSSEVLRDGRPSGVPELAPRVPVATAE